MKHKHLVLYFLLSVLSIQNVFSQEKLFTEAISKGRAETDVYCWTEPDYKKGVNVADVVEAYAEANDICILGCNYKYEKKGKNSIKYYPKCWFIPKGEIVDYVYSNVRKASIIPNMPHFSELKRMADGWFPQWYSASYVLKRGKEDFFIFQKGLLWSGNVIDGLIDGKGVGVYMDNDKKVHILSGTFKKGFPVGEYSSCSYNLLPYGVMAGEYVFQGAKAISATLTAFKDNKAFYTDDAFTAIISPDGSGVPDPKYVAFRDSIKRAEEMALAKKAREEDPENDWGKCHTIYFTSSKKSGVQSFSFTEHHSDQDRFNMQLALHSASSWNLGIGTPYGQYYLPAGRFYAEEFDDYLTSGNNVEYWRTMVSVLELIEQFPQLKKSRILADRLSHACFKYWRLKEYFDIYGNYGTLTQTEIDQWEIDFILDRSPRDNELFYHTYFPKGKRVAYSENDFKMNYASIFIEDAKRIIKSDEIPRFGYRVGSYSDIFDADYRIDFRRKMLEQLNKENIPNSDIALACLNFMEAYHLASQPYIEKFEQYAYHGYNHNYWETLASGLDAAKSLRSSLVDIKNPCDQKSIIIQNWMSEMPDILDKIDDSIRASRIQEKARFEQYKAEMCEKCRIDGSKTTVPKGWDSGNPDLIFGRPAQSDEAGKVVLVNGEEIKWKYVKYNSGLNNSEIIIEARGDYYGDYKTVEEMMSGIIRMCNDKWR